jgi:outer membrane lipoprotein-sorting protein
MKKSIFIVAGLLIATVLNAQTLDEIIRKYSEANRFDKISNFSTVKIKAKISMQGMELPVEIWMKNPDKIKTVTNIAGQEIISSFDGKKGYMINPATGSDKPVEMSADELMQAKNNNIFTNILENYNKQGKLALLGDEDVNGSPAFKIKVDVDGVNSAIMYIDKKSYLVTKSTTTVNQNGMTMTVNSFPSDYKEVSGLILPMKTVSSAEGMNIVTTYENIEVNTPIDDNVFTLK